MQAWELLRELSHPARLEIVSTISVQAMSLESIAERVNTSVQEAALHIDRLSKTGLVDREADGMFRTAPMGQLALGLLPGLDFVAAHSEYFRDQELSLLPAPLIARLGGLKDSQRKDGTVSNVQLAERIFSRSEKRIWVIANEVMLDAVPVVREKIAEGADFRFVIDQTFKAPPSFEPSIPELWRQVPRIPAATVVTENEGLVCFLDRELMVDYTVAFTSTEPRFREWCEDLVESLWNQGHPL